MNRISRIVAIPVTLLVLCVGAHGADYASPGPLDIATAKLDWHDTARDRDVPVKIYFPKSGGGPFPVILFSHGLGGTRDTYEYLGRHWASHGYVCVHLQHLGSDSAVWQDTAPRDRMATLRDAAKDPRNAIERPKDVTFAIDQTEALNKSDPTFKGRLDLDHIGIAGHSFGAYTVLASAGQVFIGPRGNEMSLPDPRITAAIAMSAPAQKRADDLLDKSYAKIKIPILHMTGTLDTSPVVPTTTAEDRRIPFDHIRAPNQYLIVFKDGDHMIFSGRGRMTGGEKDAEFQKLIKESSLAFWDAYLKGDAKAQAWLKDDFDDVLGENGSFETK
jgi:predicted dienelactone hydrolase